MIWDSDRVGAALGVVVDAEQTFSAIATDTRTLRAGALFVALTGERFDGHNYLTAARDAGTLGAVVRFGTAPVAGLQLFEVEDPLVGFGQLATARRQTIDGPVVAITGTNGKTSTKELIRAVLSVRWKTYATVDNRNNLVGVPSTILEAPPETEALVVEVGANEPGEIARLRTIIEPTAAVITNVSVGHLEGFGNEDTILEEKTALLEGAGLAVSGIVPASLVDRTRAIVSNACSAALADPADVTPSSWSIGPDGCVTLSFRGHHATLGVPGRHQGDNAMLALALGEALGLEAARMVEAVSAVVIPGGRASVIRHGDLIIIDDTYNANPASVLASLELAESLRGDRRLIIGLGSMLELGGEAETWHLRVAREVMGRAPDIVAATGGFVAAFRELDLPADQLIVADNAEDLGRALEERLRGDEIVLLKASRGIQLEKAIPFIAPTGGG